MEHVKTIGRFAAFIENDPFPSNPREEYEHASVMVQFGRFADKAEKGEWDSATVWDTDAREWVYCNNDSDSFAEWADKNGVAYDYISRPDYDAYFYMTKADILKEYGGKIVTAAKRAKAKALIAAEMAEYEAWAEGDVYAYCVYEIPEDSLARLEDEPEETVFKEDGEVVDSCCGFYGYAYAKESAIESLESAANEAAEKEAEAARTQLEADAFAANYGML